MEMSELKNDVVYGNVSINIKKIPKESADMGSTSLSDPDTALPVYGNVEEFQGIKEAAMTTGGLNIRLYLLRITWAYKLILNVLLHCIVAFTGIYSMWVTECFSGQPVL